ncbi:sulfated surface glycoprotein 185-like [Vigna umbellata]|uniref:sulfated surface glycoprotein 185-like n=1 Tax=Vigna umbellata TaxID=87088 RepID=UPI001F5F1D61|nr:sulfated surface glycoprotein 185-like [Vigna umbellata]
MGKWDSGRERVLLSRALSLPLPPRSPSSPPRSPFSPPRSPSSSPRSPSSPPRSPSSPPPSPSSPPRSPSSPPRSSLRRCCYRYCRRCLLQIYRSRSPSLNHQAAPDPLQIRSRSAPQRHRRCLPAASTTSLPLPPSSRGLPAAAASPLGSCCTAVARCLCCRSCSHAPTVLVIAAVVIAAVVLWLVMDSWTSKEGEHRFIIQL